MSRVLKAQIWLSPMIPGGTMSGGTASGGTFDGGVSLLFLFVFSNRDALDI
jgi:hypothetical protein